MKEYSIEYAHIYSNQEINQEQNLSIKILDELKDKISFEESSLVVMVDDYSFPDPTFNYEKFVIWLKGFGFSPDLVFRESQLISICDEVIKIIENPSLKKELIGYIRNNKYPCSLFISAWYLLRLGKLNHPIFPEQFCGRMLINILPESFKPFEDRAFDIIKSTRHSDSVELIINKYFKGRAIN